jgi:hypothetical protein
VPSFYDASSLRNDDTWIGYLSEMFSLTPVYVDNLLDTFPYLEEDKDQRSQEEQRLADLYYHRDEYTYTTAGPEVTYRQHELSALTKIGKPENFEEFFWRLQDRQDDIDAEVGSMTFGDD